MFILTDIYTYDSVDANVYSLIISTWNIRCFGKYHWLFSPMVLDDGSKPSFAFFIFKAIFFIILNHPIQRCFNNLKDILRALINIIPRIFQKCEDLYIFAIMIELFFEGKWYAFSFFNDISRSKWRSRLSIKLYMILILLVKHFTY